MNGYISIKQAMDDILVHPLLQDLTLERAVNYAQEFMRIVGCPKLFSEKTVMLEVKDYRALLPCDFVNIIQVRGEHGEEYRYTTDNFHFSHITPDAYQRRDLTYKIQGDVIYTSNMEGKIEVSYQSIEIDEDGFPLIPDNASFIKALELYIKKHWFTILYDLNKINAGVYQNVQQEYAWYVGQAQSDLIRPSVDEMESITNMWNALVQRVRDHKQGFKTTGTREFMRVQ